MPDNRRFLGPFTKFLRFCTPFRFQFFLSAPSLTPRKNWFDTLKVSSTPLFVCSWKYPVISLGFSFFRLAVLCSLLSQLRPPSTVPSVIFLRLVPFTTPRHLTYPITALNSRTASWTLMTTTSLHLHTSIRAGELSETGDDSSRAPQQRIREKLQPARSQKRTRRAYARAQIANRHGLLLPLVIDSDFSSNNDADMRIAFICEKALVQNLRSHAPSYSPSALSVLPIAAAENAPEFRPPTSPGRPVSIISQPKQ